MNFDFIDHFVFATPDLSATVNALETRLGVRPSFGGAHVGLGTANALLALGGKTYLEIIGPDIDQPTPGNPRPFGIDDLAEARMVTWASASSRINEQCAEAKKSGYDPGAVLDMSRRTPEGEVLQWRLSIARWTDPVQPVPFLIDWGSTKSPGTTLPAELELQSFEIVDPETDRVNRSLKALGLPIRASHGDKPELTITLKTPNGLVVLS